MITRFGSSAKIPIHFVALRIASPLQRDEQKMAVNELERTEVLPNTSKKAWVPEANFIGHSLSLGRSRRQSKYDADSTVAGVRMLEWGVFTRQLPYMLSITSLWLCIIPACITIFPQENLQSVTWEIVDIQ